MSFAVDFAWLDGTGIEGPERHAWAEIGFQVNARNVQAADLRHKSVRDRFVSSLLPLVDWMVNAWPRLIHERAVEDPKTSAAWRMSHSFRAGRGGGPMPDIRVRRRDERTFEVRVHEDEHRAPGISLSFIGGANEIVGTQELVRELSRLVEAVLENLRTTDEWTFNHLHQRWLDVQSPRTALAGRLGLTLDDQAELVAADWEILDALAPNETWCQIAEMSLRRTIAERARDAQAIAASVPSVDEHAAQRHSFQGLAGVSSGSPWADGWRTAEAFRQRFGWSATTPPRDQLQQILCETLDWPTDRQIRPVAQMVDSGGLDVVVSRPPGRYPISLLWHSHPEGRRFRIAKSLFYAMHSESSLIADSARRADHSAANAFAAELLAPRAFVSTHAPLDGYWTAETVESVARRCAVDRRVVEHQIENRQLGVLEA